MSNKPPVCDHTSKIGVQRRVELLRVAIENMEKAPAPLVRACSRQRHLASLRIDKYQIQPMSLNTLKKAADLVLEGGWKELNRLRILLLNGTANTDKQTRISRRKEITQKLREVQSRLDQERRARVVLTKAYTEVLAKLQSLARSDERLSKDLSRHLATFAIPPALEVVEGKGSA